MIVASFALCFMALIMGVFMVVSWVRHSRRGRMDRLALSESNEMEGFLDS